VGKQEKLFKKIKTGSNISTEQAIKLVKEMKG
jgi:hypothetical protein